MKWVVSSPYLAYSGESVIATYSSLENSGRKVMNVGVLIDVLWYGNLQRLLREDRERRAEK